MHGRGYNGSGRVDAALGLDLGVEPPIRLGHPSEREPRSISARWFTGIVLIGGAGAVLILGAAEVTLHRHATRMSQPDLAVLAPKGRRQGDAELRKGDRLVKTVDILAEKRSFQAPTTVSIGNKQVIRLRGYTRVTTTLTLVPTDLADQVPPFNPLKLLAADLPADVAAPAAEVEPSLDAAEVAFQTRDFDGNDAGVSDGGLTAAEVDAQVAQAIRAAAVTGNRPPLPLPPQMLLMRTSRAGLIPGPALGYAGSLGALATPFASIDVRMVPENVTVVQRSEGPRDDGQVEERLVVLRHGDTLEDVLGRNGATRGQIRAIVAAFGAKRGEPPVGEGRRIRLALAPLDPASASKQVVRLSVYLDEALEATVAITDAGQYVKVEAVDPGGSKTAAQPASTDDDAGDLRLYDGVYQTALKQGIPTPVVDTMIRIFSNDVDFQQSVQGGDSLDAFYSDPDDGEGPQLLFAALTVRDQTYRYFRFQSADETGTDYFDDEGHSVHKFLIRNPVPTGVFTSPFGMRFHPILGYSRPHTGVDWAAPVGTPILASGNGTVLKAERSPSYGNHIEIQHANDYITTYSHMVGFARGIAEGTRVKQGQVIGYLGQTGLATGPHLHYEVIVNGHFVDPMRVKLAQTRELDGAKLADFKREHDRIDALMAGGPNDADPLQRRAAN